MTDRVVIGSDGVDISGGPTSLSVVVPFPGPQALGWLEHFMDELDMPGDAIVSRMEQTRALDGTQEDEANGIRVTWTYHPDDGLSAVFSLDE